ncbi:MAG: hypothetical protein WDM79_02480 [Terricaulis sp.]
MSSTSAENQRPAAGVRADAGRGFKQAHLIGGENAADLRGRALAVNHRDIIGARAIMVALSRRAAQRGPSKTETAIATATMLASDIAARCGMLRKLSITTAPH